MLKKLLFLIILANLLVVPINKAIAEIVPLKKPVQTKEETRKKLSIDILKPLPKPILRTATEQVKEKETTLLKKQKTIKKL